MLAFCAPRGRIILLKDYGGKATYSKNFLISAVFYVSYYTTTVNFWYSFLLLFAYKSSL